MLRFHFRNENVNCSKLVLKSQTNASNSIRCIHLFNSNVVYTQISVGLTKFRDEKINEFSLQKQSLASERNCQKLLFEWSHTRVLLEMI